MKQPPFTLRRWTRVEYERLVDLGWFQNEAIELLGGQLIVAEPQGSYHASGVGRAGDAIRSVLPRGWIVRIQAPVALDEDSVPEPDIAVVVGTHDDYDTALPTRPALAVEVAHSSLGFDRLAKGSFYARAGIEDYWIVNLVERVLEIYREPAPDDDAPWGWRYRSVETLSPPASVTPLALPTTSIAVASLLPSRGDDDEGRPGAMSAR